MKSKAIKKGDLVKVSTADGSVRIMKVLKATKNELKGDCYEFEKQNAKGDFTTYKVKDKNITVSKTEVEPIDGQLMSNDLRVKVQSKLIEQLSDSSEEEQIVTTRRKKRKREQSEESVSSNPNQTDIGKKASDSQPQQQKFRMTEDGRRAVVKKGQIGETSHTGLKVVKKRTKSATVKDPEQSQKEQLKAERERIKEEKKQIRERKKKLKEIIPNKNVEEVVKNIILEPSNSKKETQFPLEG